jgi:hypothetical protein
MEEMRFDMLDTDYENKHHEERRVLRSDLLDDLNTIENVEEASQGSNESIYSQAGSFVLEKALDEWRQNTLEPTSKVHEGVILDRYIKEGLQWTWIESYENRKFAWCGAFCSYAWKDYVAEHIRKACFPSTYRLQKWAKGTDRVISNLADARPGDIIIVGKKKAWGDHITIFERADEGGYWSVEGNAYGEVPAGGKRQEGVIRRWRSEEEIHAIYRPLEVDKA